MEDENKDVDLYDELRKELEKSSEEESDGASAEKPTEEVDTSNAHADDENEELSEEDIAKLSPRAQKRIRDLAEQVDTLKKAPAEIQEDPEKKPEQTSHEFKNVKEFLDAVEDPQSRNLLDQFHKVMKGEISQTLSPIEQKNNEARFDSEFTKYKVIEGLSDHESDLKKSFMRDPNQSIDSLIGKTVLDLQLNKIKPVENGNPDPKREGVVDIDTLSLDQLYDLQDSKR